MSGSTGRRPAQEHHDGDADSDLELDLNELDPQTTPRPTSSRRKPSASRISYDFGRRIPLRNLRVAGRRQPRDQDDDDLTALVGDGEDEGGEDLETRKGEVQSYGDDDAPLLANGDGSRRRTSSSYFLAESSRRHRKRKLWDHLSFFTPGNASVALPSSALDDNNTTAQSSRSIDVNTRGSSANHHYPPNTISNAKYTSYSFLPKTLFNEFKFFFNLYFLLVALSQIIPALRIGYLSTYIAPLAFVISITLGKEAWDDLQRRRRDREANAEPYKVLVFERGSGGTNGGKGKADTGRKRAKRWKTDDAERVRQVEVEEEGLEAVEVPSSRVREVMRTAKDLRVGDVVVLGKDQRVPADVVILRSFSSEASSASVGDHGGMNDSGSDATLVDMGVNAVQPDTRLQAEALNAKPLENDTTSADPSGGGEAFIRTDQLDGETDWKLRLASPLAQTLPPSEYVRLHITAGKPDKNVNEFIGTLELLPKQANAYDPHIDRSRPSESITVQSQSKSSPLTIDNTAWANTVLASSTTVHAAVIYTGPQTRAALSTSPSRSKVGLLEHEINNLTKILCAITAALSFILVALEGFDPTPLPSTTKSDERHTWYIASLRFLILFSTIVPISLRVNLDMGKSVYAYFIHRDAGIPGTVVRTSTIPEELGRIEYLLSDKTGTLTRNEMELKKVHVGTVSYGGEAMVEVGGYVKQAFGVSDDAERQEGELFTPNAGLGGLGGSNTTRTRREIGIRVRDLVLALALCHNVTPTTEENEVGDPVTAYQASSPDEIAIVRWTEQMGLRLVHRDRKSISLQFTGEERTVVRVEILNLFPFTSDSKRMGIIVRFSRNVDRLRDDEGEIVFYQKGADTVMTSIVAANDWLDEETANMAREGLRTLVVGRKSLTAEQYSAFSTAYGEASLSLTGRDSAMARVVKQHLEHNLDLLGITGVEDKLQAHVKPSLELLRNAGIKIWMLTGDKIETARCIAVSSKLVYRNQHIHTISNLKRKETALDALSLLHSRPTSALLIDGQSLALYLAHHQEAFISTVVRLPSVIACRCTPTQKAHIALLIRAHTKKRVACIGDGGNDVSMIQAADVGVGIVGKEGKQASLAADFSITQFAHLTKLLVWHGRNSYKRSAKLAQFVIHRGLVISVCQTAFSVASHFEPIALYRDWLLVGYATIYTMAPVFSLVLDKDVDEGLANLYPELYKELTLGRSLSYKTFFVWLGISIYQGLIIQGGSELLVPSYTATTPDSETHALTNSQGFKRMVALSYTVLIVNELVMVAAEITTWHPVMIFSILGTAGAYFGSLPFLGGYFDLTFVLGPGFWWRFAAVLAASLGPVYVGKVVRRRVKPPSYRKVRGV